MEESAELKKVRKNKEEAILSGNSGGGETFSTLQEYAAAMAYTSTDSFISELEGKSVLDLGSGLGGLAKSAAFKQVDTHIFSINPRLAHKRKGNVEEQSTQEYVDMVAPKTSKLGRLWKRVRGIRQKDYLQMIQQAHDSKASAGFAHELPFKDNTFDLILDKDSVSKYATAQDYDFMDSSSPEEKELFVRSINEMLRVLKPGGKIRVMDIFGYGTDEDWKQKLLNEMGVEYKLIMEDLRDQQIYPNLWGDYRANGVEIYKKAA